MASSNKPVRGGGRPSQYRTSDGKRVPGVTTILSRFKESGGLIHWAWQCGLDGKDYRQERDSAAEAGHIAHDWIEASIHGAPVDEPQRPVDVPEDDWRKRLDSARKSLDAYLRWSSAYDFTPQITEVAIISDRLRVGGTLDCVGTVAEQLCLIDWKTSRGVYGEYLVQLGGYMLLWEEEHPDKPLSGAHLLRFDKETANFTHYSWERETLEIGAHAFELLRDLYEMDRTLKKAVA